MKAMNSMSAVAVPRNGSSFGPGILGRGCLLIPILSGMDELFGVGTV